MLVASDLEALGATAFAALFHAEDGSLAARAAAYIQLFGFVFVAFDPADIGFVYFDNALQLRQIAAAGFADLVSMNQADPCRMPISFDNCRLEIPLRAVSSKYMAYSHLCSGIWLRSKMVPVRTVKSSWH